MKTQYKTKKVLLKPNQNNQKLIEQMMFEARCFYNDLIFVFKTFQDGRELNNLALSCGAEDLQETLLEDISKRLKTPIEEMRKFLINKNGNPNFSFQAFTYFMKFQKDRYPNLPTVCLASCCKRASMTIANFFTKAKAGASCQVKYASKYDQNWVGFNKAPTLKGNKLIFQKPKTTKGLPLTFKCNGDYININQKFKTSQIVKEGKRYFTCVVVAEAPPTPKDGLNDTVGIDWGVRKLATLSDGKQYDSLSNTHPNLEKWKKKRLMWERRLAKRKKGSKGYKEAKYEIAKYHRKISNTRKTYIETVTRNIADENKNVVVEELKIKNMTKSSKGDEDNHGKNVKQKSGLNKAILDHAPYMFKIRLEQKISENGGKLVEVAPQYTSRTCNCCGFESKENRKDELFKCLKCGHKDNADVNAAKNILSKAM